MFLYQAAVALMALGLAGTALLNFWCFRKPRALVAGDADLPLISILVPARDEEANIEACVRSLLALNYPRFEVIVLDDHSSDDTYPHFMPPAGPGLPAAGAGGGEPAGRLAWKTVCLLADGAGGAGRMVATD